MTEAVASGADGGGRPFVDATPAQIRAALTTDDADTFDQHWRSVMLRATERQDLTELFATLESWRHVAWLTSALGHDGYRQLLATTEQTLRTGEPPAGTVPWDQMKAELGLAD